MSASVLPAARSTRLPIIDQLRDAATEREAAALMLCLPLSIIVTRTDVIRRALEAKGFSACLDYLENIQTACRLVRKPDPRMAGDLGTARVALQLQQAGVTLQAVMDRAATPETDEPAFLDVGTHP